MDTIADVVINTDIPAADAVTTINADNVMVVETLASKPSFGDIPILCIVASLTNPRKIFAEEGAKNVSWVWSPNWNDSPRDAWNAKAEYYPGDDQVDWVGVSGYNLHREAPGDLFGQMYADYATRKPLMITEVGAVDRGGRTKADWITLLAGWVEKNPGVGAVVWFDTDTHPGFDEKWRIDTDPASLAAFQTMARDPHFSA